MNRKSAADLLREKYMSTQLKKTALEKTHPKLDELYGVDYLKPEIQSKLYNPLFNADKYRELGTIPPKSVLIRGIHGVGKAYIVSCFCQHFQIPLITGFVETAKDIRELFSKSRSTERSVILFRNVEQLMKEDSLIHYLNESINAMDWNALVVMTNTDTVDQVRYDSEIFVKIPTMTGRREILEGLLRNMRTKDLDLTRISQNIPGFVSRDIVKLISMVSTRAINRETDGLNSLSRVSISKETENTQRRDMAAAFNTMEVEVQAGTGGCITMEDFSSCIREWKNINQNITFDDIGALDLVKEELTMSILLPSRYPEKFAAFGIVRPSGVLLHGPPGCGKTLIAKAVSNMSHCNFLSIKGPELITKYVGDSEKHLRDLFQKAKNLSPCVLFFDEIDSLCGKRGKNEFGNRIVNQILTLLDGMEDRGEVYLIGATNRIDTIDKALLRPGRFDKVIEVTLPSRCEANEIFKKSVRMVPHEEISGEGLNLEGLSGAEIAGVVKEAAVMCLKENFQVENLKITKGYFIKAIEKMKEMKRNDRKRRTE